MPAPTTAPAAANSNATAAASLSDQDLKLVGIAQKLIDVELMTREDEEDENAKEYTPDQIKDIAIKILNSFKVEKPDAGHSVKEFKAFVSKSKSTYWLIN